MILRSLSALLVALIGTTTAQAGCADQPEPCQIDQGTYHLVLPDSLPQDGSKPPAIVFLHGYGGTGAGMLTIGAMTKAFLGQGFAIIAPDGLPREQGAGESWAVVPGRAAPRDDVAFVISAADDAARRFGLDRSRMLLAGFSLGGSMTSYVACEHPEAFAAYAPVAGSFWKPLPASCAGPVRLFHTHGTADTTVPLTGREIQPGIAQGDVFKSLRIFARTDGCAVEPSALPDDGPFTRSHWQGCTPGGAASVDLALHPGSHGIPPGWADMILNWLEPTLKDPRAGAQAGTGPEVVIR